MRMKDLVAASGLPRTAIHHYQREGLLPPATKTARNAALYGPEHVERLRLIATLRGDELGPLSLAEVREVLTLVDRGQAPAAAVALRSLPGGVAGAGGSRRGDRSLSDLAHDSGLSLGVVRALQGEGLLPGRSVDGDKRSFDEVDAAAAGLLAGILSNQGVRPADLSPIAELMGELVRYEKALAGLATAKSDPARGAEMRRAMFRDLHRLHIYLFHRLLPEPAESG